MTLLQAHEQSRKYFSDDFIEGFNLGAKTQYSRDKEEKTGKWIYDDEAYPGGNPYGHYDCDQCGESVPHKTNYCPNCGARMENKNESI